MPSEPSESPLPLPPRPGLDFGPDVNRRVELTVSCRDADVIPRVPDAGEVRTEAGTRIQVMHEGTKVVAGGYHGDWMSEVIRRLRGVHEPQEELVIHRIIERITERPSLNAPVMVELGAFWSYYSLWAMRALGASALLVEPDPGSLAVGAANLELNGLAATLVNAAVGGEHGGSIELRCESDDVVRELPTVTVPGLVQDHQLPAIDILLADCQGPELDVITRAEELLRAGTVRFLVLSTHHHSISGDPMTHQNCLALVNRIGGHVIAEHSVGESVSGDGLIAAAFRPEDADLTVPISYARYRDSLFGELEPELAAALARPGS